MAPALYSESICEPSALLRHYSEILHLLFISEAPSALFEAKGVFFSPGLLLGLLFFQRNIYLYSVLFYNAVFLNLLWT